MLSTGSELCLASLWKNPAEQAPLLGLQRYPARLCLTGNIQHGPDALSNGGTWVWSHSWRSPWKGLRLSSVVWRIQPCMACTEQAPDASPTHGSGNEHVCARLVQLWENSKGAMDPKRNIHRPVPRQRAFTQPPAVVWGLSREGNIRRALVPRDREMYTDLPWGWRCHLWGLCVPIFKSWSGCLVQEHRAACLLAV